MSGRGERLANSNLTRPAPLMAETNQLWPSPAFASHEPTGETNENRRYKSGDAATGSEANLEILLGGPQSESVLVFPSARELLGQTGMNPFDMDRLAGQDLSISHKEFEFGTNTNVSSSSNTRNVGGGESRGEENTSEQSDSRGITVDEVWASIVAQKASSLKSSLRNQAKARSPGNSMLTSEMSDINELPDWMKTADGKQPINFASQDLGSMDMGPNCSLSIESADLEQLRDDTLYEGSPQAPKTLEKVESSSMKVQLQIPSSIQEYEYQDSDIFGLVPSPAMSCSRTTEQGTAGWHEPHPSQAGIAVNAVTTGTATMNTRTPSMTTGATTITTGTATMNTGTPSTTTGTTTITTGIATLNAGTPSMITETATVTTRTATVNTGSMNISTGTTEMTAESPPPSEDTTADEMMIEGLQSEELKSSMQSVVGPGGVYAHLPREERVLQATDARASRMEKRKKKREEGTEEQDLELSNKLMRKMKNRESAVRSRNRQIRYTDTLEKEVNILRREKEELEFLMKVKDRNRETYNGPGMRLRSYYTAPSQLQLLKFTRLL